MGHIIRLRELVKSASELTGFELSPKRKKQLADVLDKDFVSKIKDTRFVGS